MSWSISAIGTREGVVQAVEQQKAPNNDPEQERQFERARQAVLAELSSWPPTTPEQEGEGIRVEAFGHRSKEAPGSMQIKIEPVKLALKKRNP